jgi:hypothetical protein
MAEQIIDENRDGLVQLAELLLEREVVFTEDVERIFGKRKGKGKADDTPKEEVTEIPSAEKAEV